MDIINQIWIFLSGISLITWIPTHIGMWMVFKKADEFPLWSLIPIVNTLIILRISGQSFLWIILYLIPGISYIGDLIICIFLAQRFGKDSLFGIGLSFLGFIFYPVLGFGDAQIIYNEDQNKVGQFATLY